MSDGDDNMRVFGVEDPVEFAESGYSRTGIEMWEAHGRRWFEKCVGSVSPVAITLEAKAALTTETGNWPANERAWRLLPRWQRAELWRLGKRSFPQRMGYRQARRYGREVLGYVP